MMNYCGICSKQFSTKYNFQRHNRVLHRMGINKKSRRVNAVKSCCDCCKCNMNNSLCTGLCCGGRSCWWNDFGHSYQKCNFMMNHCTVCVKPCSWKDNREQQRRKPMNGSSRGSTNHIVDMSFGYLNCCCHS
jgi:hypothetical protein